MFLKIAQALVLGSALAAPATAPPTQEAGITPSQVYGLWTNINDAVVATAGILAGGAAAAQDVADMKPKTFSGKTPGETMKLVLALRDKVNKLRAKTGLEPVAAPDGTPAGRITPADVFLSSGRVQDGIVDWIISNSGDTMLVSAFYAKRSVSGKTPDEAFAMIDLASRRFDSILARR